VNIPGKILQVQTGCSCTLVLSDQGFWASGYSSFVEDNEYRNIFTKPKDVMNISGKILQFATSGPHSIILTDEGLWAKGFNNSGQLGLGHNSGEGSSRECSLQKVENIPGKILQVVTGGAHTIVLTDQQLYVCGSNYYGVLGIGLRPKQFCKEFTEVKNIPGKIIQAAAGRSCTLILSTEGLWVCGKNDFGELGLGNKTNRDTFTKVEDIPGKLLQVNGGDNHIMVLTSEGLWTSGGYFKGKLGLSVEGATESTTFTNLTQVENLPRRANQEEYDYLPPETIRKIYPYISSLVDLVNPVKKEDNYQPFVVTKVDKLNKISGCGLL